MTYTEKRLEFGEEVSKELGYVSDLYYQGEAKRIIDSMFDSKVFNEKITRNDMQGFENLIAFYFESHAKTTKKSIEFILSVTHLKK